MGSHCRIGLASAVVGAKLIPIVSQRSSMGISAHFTTMPPTIHQSCQSKLTRSIQQSHQTNNCPGQEFMSESWSSIVYIVSSQIHIMRDFAADGTCMTIGSHMQTDVSPAHVFNLLVLLSKFSIARCKGGIARH